MNKRVGFIVTHCLLADHVSSHLMLNGGLGKRTRKGCHEDAVVLFFLHYDFYICTYHIVSGTGWRMQFNLHYKFGAFFKS